MVDGSTIDVGCQATIFIEAIGFGLPAGLIVALTPGHEETAWSLVVDDLTRPAFLQPPIPSGQLEGYSIAGETPDEIDVLVTSKNHDVKVARAGAAERLERSWIGDAKRALSD